MSNFPMATLPNGIPETTLQQLAEQFTEQQLLWMSGYFYGLATAKSQLAVGSTQLATAPSVSAASISNNQLPPTKLTILYGSQTGNSKKIANLAADRTRALGFAPTVVDMGEYQTKSLKSEKLLLVVIATYGEGEPPSAAEEFYNFLHGSRAPKLPDVQFSVLALGDKSYLQYCQTGVDFDKKLEQLGAKRLADRVDCDVDWHDDADRWLDSVVEKLAVLNPQPQAVGSNGSSNGFVKTAISTVAAAPKFDRKNPFAAEVLEKIQLNGRGSIKETWHVELSLEGSGLTYEVGDALAVVPTNSERIVAEVLKAGNFDPSVKIQFDKQNAPFGDVLLEKAELTTLTRDVLQRYFDFSKNEKLKSLLADPKALQTYIYGRDVVDMLADFPTAEELTPQYFSEILRKMPSRAYSIASSLTAHPDEVHLTVGALRYKFGGRRKEGVASSFLADRVSVGEKVSVFVEQNEYFKLPKEDETDIIMVGPGTGVAPFRAFVEERAEVGASGKNWLVFGNPHFTTDFLYQTEWQQHLKKGILSRLDVAFSRDQADKIYVQHRLLQKSKQIYDWLQNGATFYVCGDKNRMAHDVERALTQVVEREAGISAEKAVEFVKNLKKTRRYLEDVY